MHAWSAGVLSVLVACSSGAGSGGDPADGGGGTGGAGGSGGSAGSAGIGGSAGSGAGCLLAPPGLSDENFGQSVALDGTVLAVGVDTPGASLTPGAVHVLRRSGAIWEHEARLDVGRDSFGLSVAVSGSAVLVGSPLHEDQSYEGKAYVYRHDGATWALEATIEDPDSVADYNHFGTDVALDGDVAVIGAPAARAAYAFRRSGSSWALESALDPAESDPGFGASVDVDGDLAIVGAPGGPSLHTGTAHVFRLEGTSWVHEAELARWGAGQTDYDHFGAPVAIDGDIAVVGAVSNEEHGTQAGALYVYRRSGTSWAQEAKLHPDSAPPNAFFGSSVALDGNRLVATTYKEVAFVFEHDGTSFKQIRVLESTPKTFGWGEERAALSGSVAAVGAYGNYGYEHPGAVCIFDL
jgi:hypothetical protein